MTNIISLKMSQDRRWIILLGLSVLCFLSGCSHSGWIPVQKYTTPITGENSTRNSTKVSQVVWKERHADNISPGYLVAIKSPDAKLNDNFRVEFDGSLKLPYKVIINTTDLNEEQLQDTIRKSYKGYFRSLNDIQISIVKKEYFVSTQGLVQKPGEYVVQETSSLDEIIAQAGGLKEGKGVENTAQYVRISGPSGSGIIRLSDYYSGSKQLVPHWQGGETVFFQTEAGTDPASPLADSHSIQIIGQVRNPAAYQAEPNADFFTYLVKAGGPTDRADPSNIILIRVKDNVTHALTFDMLDVANIPQILPGDAIIVSADNASPLEKKSRVGANFANILTAIGVVVIAGL